MTSPVVYALIINYNGWRHTIECLASLYASDYPNLHLMVLDSASTDDSVARIHSWAATAPKRHGMSLEVMSLQENLGFAGANNVGLQHFLARERDGYAWLLNNDTVADASALRKMVDVAQGDGRIGAVGATLLKFNDPERLETAGGGTFQEWHGMIRTIRAGARRSDPRPPLGRIDFISGTCMLVPRHVVATVGLLDERYFLYAEDIDWSARIRDAGFRLGYCASAEVLHRGGGSTVHKSAVHDYYNVKSSLLLVHKRHSALLPLAFAYSAVFCAMPKVLRGEWRRLGVVTRAWRDFVRQVTRGDGAVALIR